MRKLWRVLPLLTLLLGCKPHQESSDPATTPTRVVAPIAGIEAYPGATEVSRKEHDEGGYHVAELALSTKDSPEQVASFYERRLQAKAMPMNSGMMSIQSDMSGS